MEFIYVLLAVPIIIAIFKMKQKLRAKIFALMYKLYRTRLGYYLQKRKLKDASMNYPQGHSLETTIYFTDKSNLILTVLPYGTDNYAYFLASKRSKSAILFDFGMTDMKLARATENNYNLMAAFATHWHWDHTAGYEHLSTAKPDIKIFGNKELAYPTIYNITGGEQVEIQDFKIKVIPSPGHTSGSLCYLVYGAEHYCPNLFFTGDTWFNYGCGRTFETDAPTLANTLVDLVTDPDVCRDTRIFGGHEYSLDNLNFANAYYRNNDDHHDYIEAVNRKLENMREDRKNRIVTIGTTVEEEFDLNPFLRAILSDADREKLIDQSTFEMIDADYYKDYDEINHFRVITNPPIPERLITVKPSGDQLDSFAQLRAAKDRWPNL